MNIDQSTSSAVVRLSQILSWKWKYWRLKLQKCDYIQQYNLTVKEQFQAACCWICYKTKRLL